MNPTHKHFFYTNGTAILKQLGLLFFIFCMHTRAVALSNLSGKSSFSDYKTNNTEIVDHARNGRFSLEENHEVHLQLPQNNSTVYQTIPYFSWTSANVSNSDFTSTYQIEIDNNIDFSSPEDTDQVPSFINYYSTDIELAYDTKYYWRVRYVNASNIVSEWSETYTFEIEKPKIVIEVLATDGWDEIRAKWQSVLSESTETQGAVELRFPENEVLHAIQDPLSDESERSNGFLLYVNGYDNVIVNGRGTKIVIEATHGEWLCGFMEVNNSDGIQVKDLTVDYQKNSILQIAGVVQNFDKENRTFEVVVDTSIYDTYEVLKDYDKGYFLSKDRQQKIGLKGVHYTMEQTWEEAKVNATLFRFTCGSSEYGRYKVELADGDYFVQSERSGDVFYLKKNVSNFLINNINTHASRGRFLAVSAGSSNTRSIHNKFLRTQGRIMGSSSGGVGSDRGNNSWYENNRFEYTRDDMFHSGSNAGKGSVFRNNELIGAYRNSIWVQADRSWIAGNNIDYAGTNAIHIGYAPSHPGTMPTTVLVEENTITRPNWYGILTNSNTGNPDFETGSLYNEDIHIRNNHIIDNQRDAAIHLTYVKNATVENNLVTNTLNEWSVYANDKLQQGVYIDHSQNISGCKNQIVDTRIEDKDYLFLGTNTTDINLCLSELLSLNAIEAKHKKLVVYPNPCSSGIFYASRIASFEVFQLTGEMVATFRANNRIDLTKFKDGTYLLKDIETKETAQIIKIK